MALSIFKVKYTTAVPDPDMPQPRYHTVIFAQTNQDKSGTIHEVNGDLVIGMRYEANASEAPEMSAMFHQKEFLGTVSTSDYPAKVDQICWEQPPPPRQKSFNSKTYRTEQHKLDGTFYAPGEPRPLMIKCTEWTEQQVIPAMYASGILQKLQPSLDR